MPNKIPSRIPGRLEVQAAAGSVELIVYGDIGESWDGRSIEAIEVVTQLASINASEINVRINSYGGSCSDGLAIYNALKRHPAKINVTIDGVAASCASVIAMAGDTITMPANTWMMVHAPWGACYVEGNAKDAEEAVSRFVDVLESFANSIAQCYAAKTGHPFDEMLVLVTDGEDHYMTAAQALEAGFCDAILDDSAAKASAASALTKIATQPQFKRLLSEMPQRVAASLRINHSNSGDRRGDIDMPGNTQPAPAKNNQISAEARQEIIAQERERVGQIRAFAEKRPSLAHLAERAIVDGLSMEAFSVKALQLLGSDTEPVGHAAELGLFGTREMNRGTSIASRGGTGFAFVEAASDVLAARAGIRIAKPHAGARDILDMSVAEIAKACLSRADRGFGDSKGAVIRAAMSTSDFPAILEATLRKAMRRGYEDEPGTHSVWIRRTTVPDFKQNSRVILGSMPELQHVLEGAEYPHGAVDEDKSVPFAVDKYGRIVAITWEALVNDDLNALGRIPQGMGQAARRKEADLVYALFDGSGQVMQDGEALFHVNHANLAASSAGLTKESLAAGRLLLRKQLAVGGGALNLKPRFLLVPPELESDAEEIIAASSIHVSSGVESATPEWIRTLELVVEARLPATAFYLLASNAQIDTAELAYLEEDDGPVVDDETDFVRDVKSYKVRAVMGTRALDWRGFVKVPISG